MTRFPLLKSLVLFLAAAFVPAALFAKAPAQARPALWVVSDPDTTIYLFGTIHLLPQGMKWRSEAFDRAEKSAGELVVETIVDDKNPAKLIAALTSMAFTPGLPPLEDRVPAKKRAQLKAAVMASGFPPEGLDKMETWAAAIMLMGGQFKDLGLKVDQGIETVLRNDFTARNKPIGELESNSEQFGYFDRLSEKAQRTLLVGAIENSKDVGSVFNAMIAAWSSGDLATIAKTFNEDLKDSPELGEHIIVERNGHWARWVRQRLERPGTVMVAVGAGHLAGPNSLLAMLAKQGIVVRRVQ